MFRGTGGGSGGNPISSSWQQGMATNVCPGEFMIKACLDSVKAAAPECPSRCHCERAANTSVAPTGADRCTSLVQSANSAIWTWASAVMAGAFPALPEEQNTH